MKKNLSIGFLSVLACAWCAYNIPLSFAQTSTFVRVTSISVSSAVGSVSVGGTLQMTASVSPSNATGQTVSWSVDPSDTALAAISPNGLLTARAPGTVTVIASANDGSGISGSAQVTVNPLSIQVTSISVTSTSSVSIGGTVQMTATISPSNATNQTVAWSVDSGGAAFAVVSPSGLLTARAPGTVTVRATANDGSGISGSAQVTVNPSSLQVTGISVSGSGSVSVGSTLQMAATISPSNATNQTVAWSVGSSDAALAVVSPSGLLTARAPGTVTVIASANDGSGISGSAQVTINLPTYTTSTYALTYGAGMGGSISGTSLQTVTQGSNGTAVTAVPSSSYQFMEWSDGSTVNPRTDLYIEGNVSTTAIFSPISAPNAAPVNNTGATAAPARLAQLQAQLLALLEELLALLQSQTSH